MLPALQLATAEQNCALVPRTTEVLRALPSACNARFSSIAPHQSVMPHFGCCKGFVRYHLGVILSDDDAHANDNARVDLPQPSAASAE